MAFSTYLPLLFLWIIILNNQRRRRRTMIYQAVINPTRKENSEMFELAKKFINKDCIIYSFENQFRGIITEVNEGAVLVEKNGSVEAINLNFVLRIRECPKDKKGKAKSVVLD